LLLNDVIFIYIPVVSASLEFMDSDTMISEKKDSNDAVQPISAMRKTPLLCQVTDPEEKRRIIGDTFMLVANEVLY
jgi:GMP synthase PP-ATPase subunit